MKRIFFILVSLLIGSQSYAQFIDSFNRAHTIGNSWFGDTTLFAIKDSSLQLADTNFQGLAILSQPISIQDTLSFAFEFKLDFNPSTNNQLTFWIVSDNPDPTQTQNGYFFQVGESGSQDALKFYQMENGKDKLLANSSLGQACCKPHFKIKFSMGKQSGFSLSTDSLNLGFDKLQFTLPPIQDSTIYSYFHLICKYTTSNKFAFTFDDFSLSPFFKDTIKPEITGIHLVSDSTIALKLSESIASYDSILIKDGAGVFHPAEDSVKENLLYFNIGSNFLEKKYALIFFGFDDKSGNQTKRDSIEFQYWKPRPGLLYFTEIFADPTPDYGLGSAEFIEIYNPNSFPVSFDQSWLMEGNDSIPFPAQLEILPLTTLVLAKGGDSLFENGIHFPIKSLLNSSEKIALYIRGELVDSITYFSSWFSSPTDGLSMQRFDFHQFCPPSQNWFVADTFKPGNPGEFLPRLDSFSLQIDSFYARNDHVFLKTTNFLPSQEAIYLDFGSFLCHLDSGNSNQLTFFKNENINRGVFYPTHLKNLKTCRNQYLNIPLENPFFEQIENPQKHIKINEILFNPSSGGVDFVEIVNTSDSLIDLRGLQIKEFDTLFGTCTDSAILLESKYIHAKEILVLTTDSATILFQYPHAEQGKFIQIKSLPNYADKFGIVTLSLDNQLCDSLFYHDSWHSSLLRDKNGASLERMNAKSGAHLPHNWMSGNSSQYFASPGLPNLLGPTNLQGEVLILNRDFLAPGTHFGLLEISLEGIPLNTLVNLKVISEKGIVMKDLLQSYIPRDGEIFVWDGTHQNGQLLGEGLYFIEVEILENKNYFKYLEPVLLVTGNF